MITSLSNQKIKSIRKLKHRKERENRGVFYLEGLRIVGEAFQQNAQIDELIISYDLLKSEFGLGIIQQANSLNIPVIEVSKSVFEKLADKDNPQGIAAVGRQKWSGLDEITTDESKFWIALDAAQDPGNIGTILRTSDAVGSAGIILLDESSDPYSPSAIRASMGAVFSQKLIKSKFEDFASWKRNSHFKVIGTSGESSIDYQEMIYPEDLIILMGSERQGLLEKHIKLCDEIVSIPMIGRSDSLNLAIATAVVLYEVFNQKRSGKGERK